MQRTLFSAVSSQIRRTANVTPSTRIYSSAIPASRFLSTSSRLCFPGPNPAPTASEDAVAADRGETIEEDITTTVKQTVHKVVQKGQADEAHEDPHHPGRSDIDHLESPSISEEAVHADKHTSDPLAPHQKASSSSSSSSFTATTREQVDAQHPGRAAAPSHLENPSLSEAFVHADREGADPLAGKTVNAKSHPAQAASGVASNLASAAGKVAGAVKDAVGSVAGKKSFSTSVRQSKEGETQHLEKSGHEHLDKPSVPEEEVHADKSDKDPLAGTGQKASERKGDKAGIADSKVQQSKN